jgi:hypothetical protein
VGPLASSSFPLPSSAHGHRPSARTAAPQPWPAMRSLGSQPWIVTCLASQGSSLLSFFPLTERSTGAGPGRPQPQRLGHGGAPVPATLGFPSHREQHRQHPRRLQNVPEQAAKRRSGWTHGPRRGAATVPWRAAVRPRSCPSHGVPTRTISPEAPQDHELQGTSHTQG